MTVKNIDYNRFSLPKLKIFDKALDITIENLKKTIKKLLEAQQNSTLNFDDFLKLIEQWVFHKHILFIGWNQISWSLSPFMHTYSWYLAWINILYTLMDVSGEPEWILDNLLYEIENNSSILWANITMPYKVKVYEKLKALWQLDDWALLAWAVNTISKQNGKIIWFNTDMQWVVWPIQARLGKDISKICNAYVFWCWWAAKAAIAGLLKMWISNIHVFNRTPKHLLDISNHFNSEQVRNILQNSKVERYFLQLHEYDVSREENFDISEIIIDKWILVNTLPFWFKDNYPKYPIRKEVLEKIIGNIALYFDVVYDMNYLETPMMSFIQKYKYVPTCDWRDMVIWQAKKWFELWTGKEFNLDIIKGMLK